MLPYQSLIEFDRTSVDPLYKQITNRLISLIQDGVVQPGVYFPGTRQMADSLNVNRKTVINAYESMLLQEWIEAVPRKGYRVIPKLPGIKPRSFQPKNHFIPAENGTFKNSLKPEPAAPSRRLSSSDLVVNDGFPDAGLAPFKELGRIYRDPLVSEQVRQLMSLRDEGGLGILKESAATFLNQTRGLNITQNDIVLTRGAQMAIYITAMVMLNPGDLVVVSEPNYLFASEIVACTGASILTVPVDEHGLDVDQLEELLLVRTIKLLYIVPHHHHPTTVTMSADRRRKLLKLIEQYSFFVIEDDYDYDFHYQNSPILPLASAAHNGKIIYIGSFTKLLAPSVRVGYLIAAPYIVKKAIHLRRLIDLRGDTFVEYMLAQMINNGELTRHIVRSNRLYAQRCDHFCDLLTDRLSHAMDYTKPQGGMAVWLRFKQRYPVNKVIADAAQHGLFLTGMSYQREGDRNDNGLRFGFASLNENDMERAIAILEKILK